MSSTVTELKCYIDYMMKSEEVANYQIEISGGNAKGEGFLGEIAFVTIKTPRKIYEVVVKTAKQSSELRRQTPIKEVYDREIYFYNKIVPIFEEFQNEMTLEDVWKSFPKCFSVCEDDGKEAVILENLKASGFGVHNRKKEMNLNHVKMVFSQYAKLHGLSMALKNRKPKLFKSVTKNMTNLMGKLLIEGKFMNVFYKDFENVKRILKESKEAEALMKFEGFDKDFEKILLDESSVNNKNSVILHGDCWNNNFMFKYENENRSNPTSMRFLDFQLSRLGTPIFDLSYFLYCCADSQVLKHFDYLLQVYHSTLSDFLTQFDVDAEDTFPFKSFKEEWRRYGKYGLVMSQLLLRVSLCEAEKAPDFAETAESGGSFEESFTFELEDNGEYERRVKEVFLHFAEQFL